MREWLLVVAPLVPVIYFVIFPEELPRLFDWVIWTRYWITAFL